MHAIRLVQNEIFGIVIRGVSIAMVHHLPISQNSSKDRLFYETMTPYIPCAARRYMLGTPNENISMLVNMVSTAPENIVRSSSLARESRYVVSNHHSADRLRRTSELLTYLGR